MKEHKKISILTIAQIAIFTAVISILSQLSIPLPTGVPITLQTLAIAITGFVLGTNAAVAATIVYILLGAVGVPVFSNFSGGFACLVSPSGGFFWGFILMAFFCGFGMRYKNKLLSNLFGLIGLALCYVCGALQFGIVTHTGFIGSVVAVVLPYVVKDVISIVAAYILAIQVRKALFASNLLERRA